MKNNNIKKICLYEYLDIVNPVNDLKNIENESIRLNKWSWELLVEKLKQNVIINYDINIFINNILENIEKMDKYYISGNFNKNIDINKKNQELFNKLQYKEILKYCHDIDFYKMQKNKINHIINFICKIYDKRYSIINIKQQKIFNNMLINNYNEFKIRLNIIIRIYKLKNNIINHEDDLIMNISKIEDFKIIRNAININKKIYNNIKIPKYIIEKRENSDVYKIKYSRMGLNLYNYDYNKIRFTYIINSFKNDSINYKIKCPNNKDHYKYMELYFDLFRKRRKI